MRRPVESGKYTVLDARSLGLDVVVIEDAVGGVDVNRGDSKGAVEEMKDAGAAFAAAGDVAEAKAQGR
ncbi:MAG: hypothetical protein ACRDNE_01040 [Gaiellaceae bacterium]